MPFTTAFILASFEGLEAAGRRLNSTGTSRETAIVIIAIVAVAAFWAGLYVWDRRRRPLPVPTDNAGLFGELCRAHRLGKEDRNLLHRAGRGQTNSAIVFVNPDVLHAFGQTNPHEATNCERLHERLFGTSGRE